MMKKICFIFFALSLGYSVQAQNPQVKNGVLMIGLVVEDITESEKFYTEVLGMVATGGFSLDKAWSKQAGMADGEKFSVKTFKMKSRESATVLKLAYFKNVPPKKTIKSVQQAAGINYLTFLFDDLDPLRKKIIENNIPVVGTVGDNLIIIQDPNGIFIELFQPPK